jgi:hypothetical protein
MTTALVVGNGESRNSVDLNCFTKDYETIGCNALHRDYKVDHLVCCDRRMIEESIKSENTNYTQIYVRPDWFRYFRKVRKDKRIHSVPELPYNGDKKEDQPLHWGSGPYAVLLASQLQDTVMMIGFDLYSSDGFVNNIYKGTDNYALPQSNPVDYVFWIYQIAKVFKHNPEKYFIVWNHAEWNMPKQWNYPNVSFENINKF